MRSLLRKLLIPIIIVAIIFVINQKSIIEEKQKIIDLKNEVLTIKIIDKNNNMKKIHNDPESEEWVIVDLLIDDTYYTNVGIRTKGSTVYTWLKMYNSKKYSYKVKLDYINPEQEFNGMKEIHLNSQVMDATEIREYLIYDLYNRLGIETQQYCFANLRMDEEDFGLVTLVEVINEEYVEEKYNSTEGNLYKPATEILQWIWGAELQYTNDNVDSYKGIFNYVKSINTGLEDKMRLVNIIKKLDEAKSMEEIEKYFYDFDKVIQMVAINKAVANLDTFAGRTLRNFFIYEENGKMDIIPFDFNISLGMYPKEYFWTERDVNAFSLIEINEPVHSKIVDIIYEYDEYHEKFVKYMEEALFTLNNMENNGYIDNLNFKVSPIIKNGTRKLYSDFEHEESIIELKQFINDRTANFMVHSEDLEYFKEVDF